MRAQFGRNLLRTAPENMPQPIKVIITIVMRKLKLWLLADFEAEVAAKLSPCPLLMSRAIPGETNHNIKLTLLQY